MSLHEILSLLNFESVQRPTRLELKATFLASAAAKEIEGRELVSSPWLPFIRPDSSLSLTP